MKRFILFGSNHYYPNPGFDDFKGDFDTMEEAKAAIPSEFPGQYEGWDQLRIVDTLLRVSHECFHDGDEYGDWATTPLPGERPTLWTHTKRGGIYIVDRKGKLQLDGPDDMAEVVGYTNIISNEFWLRKEAEFEDGRFIVPDLTDAEGLAKLMVTEVARHLVQNALLPFGGDWPVNPPEHNETDHRIGHD